MQTLQQRKFRDQLSLSKSHFSCSGTFASSLRLFLNILTIIFSNPRSIEVIVSTPIHLPAHKTYPDQCYIFMILNMIPQI